MTMRLRKRWALVAGAGAAAAVTVVLSVGAAGSDATRFALPSADSALFVGLPPSVVNEVLANPKAQSNASIWPSEEFEARNALWQGMVINFTQCRQMLGVYQDWKTTGKASELPQLVLPANPAGDVISSAKIVDTIYREVLASGDMSQLASLLENESGCGVWIPATPGDTEGPVIADVVAKMAAST